MSVTERKYPRTMQEAFPNTVEAQNRRQAWEWFEIHRNPKITFRDGQFWAYTIVAFIAGWLAGSIWG